MISQMKINNTYVAPQTFERWGKVESKRCCPMCSSDQWLEYKED